MNLEDLKVASPCHESWKKMTGDERARHCAKCDHAVYDISNMTRQEAEAFVRSREGMGRTCIRFHRRFDGTVITQDCPVGVRRRRLVLVGLATAATAVVGALFSVITSARSSGRAGGPSGGVYQTARGKVLEVCDGISHKFHIPSLCNCPRVSMGMIFVRPPSGLMSPGSLPSATGPSSGLEDSDPFASQAPEGSER